MGDRVRVLSFHAAYGCRNRGRCCTSGWPIAVEVEERTRITRAADSGALIPARAGAVFIAATPSTGAALLGASQGRCVFHDDDVTGGCRIQRAIGHDALPLACRQFPRQSARDPRGVSVTLSHYCPTAQDLLTSPPDVTSIVENAPAFPAGAEYIGLTADSTLPPLLHPRLAMDWESWWTFEALSVALLTEASDPLARLALAVEYARAWKVGDGLLGEHVRSAFDRALTADITSVELPLTCIVERTVDVLGAVPEEWRQEAIDALVPTTAVPVSDIVMRRYLAAHAFANWAAYLGEGLRTWFRAVETAACLLKHTADPGRADLILRHLANADALIERLGRAEREPYSPPMNG